MPEAVIVATARSPIGRAMKGSLKAIRPDDLTTQIVNAVFDTSLAYEVAASLLPAHREGVMAFLEKRHADFSKEA